MRFGTLFKQSFYFFLASSVVGLCEFGLMFYIQFPFPHKLLPRTEVYLLGVLGLITCVLWGIYRALYKHYGNLEQTPLYWLMLLFMASSLSNTTGLYESLYYRLILWFNPSFFRCLAQKASLLVYVCAVQLFFADIALQVAKWLITLRTFRVLKNQLWDISSVD